MQNENGYFGEPVAARYDDASGAMFDPAVVERRSTSWRRWRMAGARSSSGSGPVGSRCRSAAAAMPVHEIELSKAMVARLRAKPGGEAIGVTIGDFSTVKVDGTFRMAYLVFNTIGNLTTQAAQVACFRNVARAPRAGRNIRDRGRCPGAAAPAARRTICDFGRAGHWGIDEYDTVNQGLVSHHFQRQASDTIEK